MVDKPDYYLQPLWHPQGRVSYALREGWPYSSHYWECSELAPPYEASRSAKSSVIVPGKHSSIEDVGFPVAGPQHRNAAVWHSRLSSSYEGSVGWLGRRGAATWAATSGQQLTASRSGERTSWVRWVCSKQPQGPEHCCRWCHTATGCWQIRASGSPLSKSSAAPYAPSQHPCCMMAQPG